MLPSMFPRIIAFITTIRDFPQIDSLLECILSTQELLTSFINKGRVLLLDDSYIDQELHDAIQTFHMVMQMRITDAQQVLGNNLSIAKYLLSSLISACQRQLCMGGPIIDDGSEHLVTREIVHAILDCIK